jgi:hypothetical protein
MPVVHLLRGLHQSNPLWLQYLPAITTCQRSLSTSTAIAALFEDGFETFDDFLGENIGIEEIVGFFEALSLSQKISAS